MSNSGHHGIDCSQPEEQTESWVARHHHRTNDGPEYHHYASPLARAYWYFVLSLGHATIKDDYCHRRPPAKGLLLHYVCAGRVEHILGGKRYDVRPGMVCLMRREDAIVTQNRADTSTFWWVAFDGRDLPHLFAELRADREPVFALPAGHAIDGIFGQLLDLLQARGPGHEAREFAALAALLAELFSLRGYWHHPVTLSRDGVPLSESVGKSLDYIARNYRRPQLALAHIADAAGLSVRQLSRIFREEMGLTPMQYVRQHRMEHACDLLANSDQTMEQIADIVGAANQSHFAYVFRRATGQSPTAYRAAARAGEVDAEPLLKQETRANV